MSPATSRLFEDDVLLVAAREFVVAAVWYKTPTVAHVAHLGRALSRHAEDKADKVAWLSILRGQDFGTIDGAVQDAFNEMGRALTPSLHAHALVITVPGVMGMLLRTMFRGSALRSSKAYPFKIFDAVPAGVSWLRQQAPFDQAVVGRWAERLGYGAPGYREETGRDGHSDVSTDDITKRCAS